MAETLDGPDPLAALLGREVVLDLASSYVCVGTLQAIEAKYFVLKHADMHDLRDTNTTRELYVLECRRTGIHWNRRRVLVRREEVVALSALEDVRE